MEQQIAAATQAVTDLANQARNILSRLVEAARGRYDQASQNTLVAFDQTVAFNARAVEATKQSAAIIVAGNEEAATLVTSFARATVEQSFANTKALMSVTSLPDLFRLQTAMVTAYFDALRSQTEQLSTLSARVARDSVAPINANLTETLETTKQALAA
ncbi:MAG: hypothetical protein GC191_02920 [Azospirillum sp.]|nr:hypothetical protein [Azospirillum sp.]